MRHLRAYLISTAFALAGMLVLSAAAVAAQGQRQGLSLMQLAPGGSRIGASVEDTQPDQPEGAKVTGVEAGMPAAKAGVKEGDVIVEFDGERVRGRDHLTRLVRETPAGRVVKMTVLREGKRIALSVTPERGSEQAYRFEIPAPEFREGPQTSPNRPYFVPPNPEFGFRAMPPYPFSLDPHIVPRMWRSTGWRLGIGVQDLTPQLREYFGTKDGVLISSVTNASPASHAGLKAGDVITAIDGRDVKSASDVRYALNDKRAGDQVKVTIVRDHKPQTIVVTAGE